MKQVTILKEEANQRVDKYVRKYLGEAPLSFIYKLFRKKDVKINGHWVKENYIVSAGEVLTIYITDEQEKEFTKEKEIIKKELRYPIIFEDENILIVNKPRGILVHGDSHEKRLTLTNEVLNYLYFKGEYNPSEAHAFTPGPAHRLDRNTSGLVVFGKNLPALQGLEELFKNKDEINKKYLALVLGNFPNEMAIDLPLFKDSNSGLVRVDKVHGLNALSLCKINRRFKDYSLVEVTLVTGRTHQIRVHLSTKGYPIIGDGKYGDFNANREFKSKYGFENQFLHAYQLEFKDVKGYLSYLKNKKFTAELPSNMESILSELSK